MAQCLNKVMLIGYLGKDPEIKQMKSGNYIAQVSLATTKSWMNKQTREFEKTTEWHKIIAYNEFLVKNIQENLHKGAKVYFCGELKTRSWKDQAGEKKSSTEIIVNNASDMVCLEKTKGYNNQDSSKQNSSENSYDDLDEEVPF